jgi:preprotein translocase subunit YajC
VPDNSDEVEVELADNLKVRVVKSTLMDVRSKGEPVKDTGPTPAKS